MVTATCVMTNVIDGEIKAPTNDRPPKRMKFRHAEADYWIVDGVAAPSGSRK